METRARKVVRFIFRHLLTISFVLSAAFLVFYGLALRANHEQMNYLRERVVDSDQMGDGELLAENLRKLRGFVSRRAVLNFTEDPGTGRLELFWGTGTFYLQFSYRRAATEVIAAAEAEMARWLDPGVHAEVRDICDRQFSSFSQAYADCFVAELDRRIGDFAPPEIVLPDPALFHLSYASSPLAFDLATFLLLVTLLLLVVFFATLITSVVKWILDKVQKNP